MDDLKKHKRKIFTVAKTCRKDKTKVYDIKDEHGNIIGNTRELNEKWADYFNKLLNIETTENNEEEYILVFDGENRENAIGRQEFEVALKEMKDEKSPGCDNVPV